MLPLPAYDKISVNKEDHKKSIELVFREKVGVRYVEDELFVNTFAGYF